jgi:glucan phosphoethanolaminetransferase (alkaline phosphatase superfamily)
MEKLKKLKPVLLFHLLVNSAVILFITGASYYHIPLDGFKDTAIYILHLLLLQITVAGFIYFLSLDKWVFRICFTALFLLYCGFSFWAYSQDVSITLPLIQSVLETKVDIAIDVITLPYAVFFIAAIITLIFIHRRHSKIQHLKWIKILFVPAVLGIVLYFVLEEKRPGSLKNRLPYNLIGGLIEYYEKPSLNLKDNITGLSFRNDSIKMVFVLGETVRADHLGINGYYRNTTPLLSEEPNLISFKNLFTNNTYTGASVPQILTDQDLESNVGEFTSLYTVLNKANFNTTWIGNQTLEKSFAPITNTNDQIILVDKFKSVFSFDKALDETMLISLDSILPAYPRQFITIQMIGSHWWYENRYTEKYRKFTPVIDSKYIPSLSFEQMINSYDNTIVYLDFFLDEIINRLMKEEKPSVMLYVSDHGEHLGEEGKWLHAQGGEAAMNPAYMIWFSERYKERFPDRVAKIKALENTEMKTDIIFYKTLSILGIEYSGTRN